MQQPALDAPSRARPDAAAWRAFTLRLLDGAGIASLGAGIIFFVAANWQDYGVMGRFAILQAALLACVVLALWRPPPSGIGKSALVLCILLTGALLALFGQTYQTGADVYELFFTWAALAVPFALAGRSGAAWATWWLVLNIGLALYCGWTGVDRLLGIWLDRWGVERATLLLLPCLVDFAGACVFLYLRRSRFAEHSPYWLVRMLGTLAFLFGTAATISAIAYDLWSSRGRATYDTQHLIVIATFAAVCAATAVAALRSRTDVFPMALVAASWIAISTAFIVQQIHMKDLGTFFVISMWLIGTSAAAGFVLMRWVREWGSR